MAEEEWDMNYDVVAGTIPTMTLTIEMTWLRAALGLIVLVGFVMLSWKASADWRASNTPAWCRTRWQEFLGAPLPRRDLLKVVHSSSSSKTSNVIPLEVVEVPGHR